MESGFSRLLIITKEHNQSARQLGKTICDWCHGQGLEAEVMGNERRTKALALDPPHPDLILVLGGDGTILSVARKLDLGKNVPLLGLNLGQVGFLTELTPEGWQEELSRVLDGRYFLSPQVMLRYQLERGGEVAHSGRVINDLVVGRAGLARLISLKLWCEGEELGDLRADGVIVSTPIGSTAYVSAAGGALLSPSLRAMEVCPVSPFMSRFQPLVLSSEQSVDIDIKDGSRDAFLTLDGQSGMRMWPGDRIRISEAEMPLQFVRLRGSSYIHKLRNKGYLG